MSSSLDAKWLDRLATLRHQLELCAEPSGQEWQTRSLLEGFFQHHGIGRMSRPETGSGLFVRIPGDPEGSPNPCVVLRSELDALPIPRPGDASHTPLSHSHRCGHDGHMAMAVGVGVQFFLRPVPGLDLVLLFQPAEETGQGASEIVAEGTLASLAPMAILGFHNLPGVEAGKVVVRSGTFASASCGWSSTWTGRTAHAAEPEKGLSPTAAVTTMSSWLEALPQRTSPLDEPLKVTVIHFRVGKRAFGTAPGDGEVLATFRAWSKSLLDEALTHADRFAAKLASAHGLACRVDRHELFPATVNDPELTCRFVQYLRNEGTMLEEPSTPFAWSEDFGNYAAVAPLLFFGIGAGT